MNLKIEDYGIIGDTHTAAVVGLNGSIDWMCLPRFNSAACFAALLGGEENGCWRIAPVQRCQKISHQYRKDTLILETVFTTAEDTVRLIDWMPPREIRPDVIRVVEGIRGQVAMEMKLVVRFDYGMTFPWVQGKDHYTTMIAGPDALLLRSDVKTRGEGLSTVAEFTIAEGERKPSFCHGIPLMKSRLYRSIRNARWLRPKVIGPIGCPTVPIKESGGVIWFAH